MSPARGRHTPGPQPRSRCALVAALDAHARARCPVGLGVAACARERRAWSRAPRPLSHHITRDPRAPRASSCQTPPRAAHRTTGMQRLATTMIVCTMVCTTAATSLQRLRGGGKALKTEEDKALYALGCNVGRQIGYACTRPAFKVGRRAQGERLLSRRYAAHDFSGSNLESAATWTALILQR